MFNGALILAMIAALAIAGAVRQRRSGYRPIPGRLIVCQAGRVSILRPPQAEQRILAPASGTNTPSAS